MTQPPWPSPPYGAPLPYLTAGAGGGGSLPLSADNVHILNQAAEYAAGIKLMRTNGIFDLVLGGIFLAGGLLSFAAFAGIRGVPQGVGSLWFPTLLAALGAFLIAAGVWSYVRPGPGAMIADGVVLLLLFAFNLIFDLRDWLQNGNRPGVFDVLILIVLLTSGISRFRNVPKFRTAAATPLTSEAVRWLHQTQKEINRAKPAVDPSIVTFTAGSAWPPVSFKGRLLDELAVCVINTKLRFLTRAQLQATDASFAGKVAKATVAFDGRSVSAQFPAAELPRLLAWQAVGAAPAPTMPGPLSPPPLGAY